MHRNHGVKSVQNELQILKLLGGKCPFLCGLRYAFQDNVFLYMVLTHLLTYSLTHSLTHSLTY